MLPEGKPERLIHCKYKENNLKSCKFFYELSFFFHYFFKKVLLADAEWRLHQGHGA
jgi:hypothetical protein